MAQGSTTALPCDGDGVCMVCKNKPSTDDTLTCKTCVTPWHVSCLPVRPLTLADTLQWDCPDCSITDHSAVNPVAAVAGGSGSSSHLLAAIRAIESDRSLTDQEKAARRQNLLSGNAVGAANDRSSSLDESLNCSNCMHLLERPVTTPCGHNFCLKCFQSWTKQGKRSCPNCRRSIPAKMASQPRINSALVIAIRMAKMARSTNASAQPKAYHYMHNQNRPDTCFTTVRAKKSGKANACSGKIFVTTAPDHFGPIPAENDPSRNQGVLVGESWHDRMDCRQWGAHLPHVAGIAGQSKHGAQSVALSGGYKDDEDHGEWFLYTGSGGRDLSGNKRTNKDQSSDQVFENMNAALKFSCLKGYPVRVVRSHKEKRSCYAPEEGVRYDGCYRIEKCWRKKGIQGFVVCRYLFVRCDNEPAPWTSDEHGDRPRPLPVPAELKGAFDITERKGSPSWDFDATQGRWIWKKPPPESKKKHKDVGYLEDGVKVRMVKRKSNSRSMKEKLVKELGCLICRKVLVLPLTTPCAHTFCKDCLEGVFNGQAFVKQRTCEGRRTLREKKTIMKCPSCTNDISDFLQNPQVNRDLMGVIESFKQKIEEEEKMEKEDSEESSEGVETINENVDEIASDVNDSSMNASPELESPEKDEDKVDVDEQAVNVDLEKDDAKVVDVMKKGGVKQAYKKKKASDVDEAVVANGGAKTRKRKAITPAVVAETINENVASDVKDSSLNASPELESPEKDEDKVDEDEQGVNVDLEKDDAKVVDVMKKGGVKRAYKKKKASDVDEAVVAKGGAKTRKRKAVTPAVVAETINENVASDVKDTSLNASPELESPEKDEDKVDKDEQVVNVDLEKDDAKVVDVKKKGGVKRAYKKTKASDVDEAVVANGGAKTRKRKAVTPAVVA